MPKSEQEDTDLYKAFQALGIISAALDGKDVAKGRDVGEWVDSSGQSLTYTNWKPGQPSHNGGTQDYLEYVEDELKGQWNNAFGRHYENVVCERPVRSKAISL